MRKQLLQAFSSLEFFGVIFKQCREVFFSILNGEIYPVFLIFAGLNSFRYQIDDSLS